MLWVRYADDGTVIEGDDVTRIALVDGVPRPYTDDENKAADALAADALARAEHAAARAAVRCAASWMTSTPSRPAHGRSSTRRRRPPRTARGHGPRSGWLGP